MGELLDGHLLVCLLIFSRDDRAVGPFADQLDGLVPQGKFELDALEVHAREAGAVAGDGHAARLRVKGGVRGVRGRSLRLRGFYHL